MSIRLSTIEIFLLELIAWLALWLLNDYLATLLTAILVPIVLSILIISAISEFLERSKVPRKYFRVMLVSALAPIVSGMVYLYLFGGQLSFLHKI
ncbi:MAG: hypothetical protein IPL65_03500 [Lewinellaceae bacterium]|nr:hypothetical protein [Lewinellaceae bacterium]